MRVKLIVAVLSLTILVIVLLLWLRQPTRPSERLTTSGGQESGSPAGDRERHPPGGQAFEVDPRATGKVSDDGERARDGVPEDLFQRKWEEDRLVLGAAQHQEMERLWADGRKNRGLKEGIEQLKQLLERFPNTNRAGCAAFELGHSYIRHRDVDLQAVRAAAENYWQVAIDRYGDAICENNASVADRAKLGLAAWVYRYTDPKKARVVLEEVIANQAQEATPPGRMPPALTAKGLLETIVNSETSGQDG